MKANISITIDDELYQELKEEAESNNRNFSNHIETILKNRKEK